MVASFIYSVAKSKSSKKKKKKCLINKINDETLCVGKAENENEPKNKEKEEEAGQLWSVENKLHSKQARADIKLGEHVQSARQRRPQHAEALEI